MPAKVDELTDEPPTSINPYRVLDIDKDATSEQVKIAYRKAALKHHPDKAAEAEKDVAHSRFQEIAFAYAILSDPRRRSRYDTTGRTVETLSLDDEDDFNWNDYFRSQFDEVVTADAIDRFRKEYQGSEEEKLAVIEAYVSGEGDMDAVFEEVMLSNPLDDEERFRAMIDAEVAEKRVEAYDMYVKESQASRKKRKADAKKEAVEAMEMARELGVEDKLFGNGATANGKKKSSKGEGDHGALAALIQQRQKQRAGDFLADLEAKYAPKKAGGKKSKRAAADDDEPSEEAFRKTAERAAKRSKPNNNEDDNDDEEDEHVAPVSGRKAKKMKR